MNILDCGVYDEIFTFVGDDGTVLHINTNAMGRDCDNCVASGLAELVNVAMDNDFAGYIQEKRGVERWKVDRLVEPYLSRPAIGVWWDNGSVLTVDGHHRIVRWYERGDTEYPIYLFKRKALDKYLVTDLPPEFSSFVAKDVIEQVPNDVTLAKLVSGEYLK